jgi:AraC-like DNA-binding protein
MSKSPSPEAEPGGEVPFELNYFLPDPDLAEMISTFYLARINVTPFDEYERADRPQFRIMSNPNGEYIFADGHRVTTSRAIIIGPTSGRVRAIAQSASLLYGFGLMPAGWATLMGPEANSLTDRAINAEDLFGSWIHDVLDTLLAADTTESRQTIGNNFVREILKKNEPAPVWFTRTVDQWLTENLSPDVRDLVGATGMSIRSVERMTKRFYGLSPRMLARKYRAVRAAAALARGEKLDPAALGDAFYDQSHLIREIKRFSGATPGQLASPTLYTQATSQGRKLMAGKVSPLVSET